MISGVFAILLIFSSDNFILLWSFDIHFTNLHVQQFLDKLLELKFLVYLSSNALAKLFNSCS